MTHRLKIDFISDVVCPWCIIGLGGLDRALEAMAGEVDADVRFHPFELNPDMPPEGQNVAEHVAQKYGSTPEQSARARSMIRERAADVGFVINGGADSRIWNTFDAHRLLHWAGTIGAQTQRALKMAMFSAHFTDNANITDHGVLIETAEAAGLDGLEAAAILATDRFASDVRAEEAAWRQQGISAVPTLIINDRYVISGGQTAEVFERALRRIATETIAHD
jgi:predicted DsbA family dithiol-disulfide isomerase